MDYSRGQGQLFSGESFSKDGIHSPQEIKLKSDLLETWQKKIIRFQAGLFKKNPQTHKQASLFQTYELIEIDLLDPLKLTPLPLSFWRWPNSPHHGPSIYLVMDRPEKLNEHLLLYVGETNAAERRWKGEHDCKTYLAEYSEAIANAGLRSQLSIRFWIDVPKETRSRRKLEQDLIQRWLPPFNKETRNRWATPFTSNV